MRVIPGYEAFFRMEIMMGVQTIGRRATTLALAILAISACSQGEPETAYASSSATDQATVAGAPSSSSAQAAALRLVLAADGSAARYRVRERLVGHDLPNDAVGETRSVTGAVSFDNAGNVIRDASKFTLDAGTFVSDQNRRDGYVRGRILDANTYPSVTLVPTEIKGVKLPLPKTGSSPIEMKADLTVRGVTRPTVWAGTAEFKDGQVTGTAATSFTFDDIKLDQPRVPVLLSVADTIKLELDFKFVEQR
jgi:polyisoprenoid-binding protein YceI